jgi:hypothetical protein
MKYIKILWSSIKITLLIFLMIALLNGAIFGSDLTLKLIRVGLLGLIVIYLITKWKKRTRQEDGEA